MSNNLITFTIPFYQNELLLKKAIKSVLTQSSPHWRLIISLDSELSNEFISYLEGINDKRISVVSNNNKGICGNWNNCIDVVKSQYITILHSDDELAHNYIEVMLALFEKDPNHALYFCGAEIIDTHSQPKFSFADKVKSFIQPRSKKTILAGSSGLESILKGCFIFCPSICYKTDIIKKYKFRNKWQMVLDLDLYIRLLMDGLTLLGTKEKAYKYRRHENNQTAKLTNNFKRFDEEIALYDDISIKAMSLSWKKAQRIANEKNIIKLHILFLSLNAFIKFDFSRGKSTMLYLLKLIRK
ncbi:glycosyltransferase family 2 protein [Colwelliaceae bacterium 6441]